MSDVGREAQPKITEHSLAKGFSMVGIVLAGLSYDGEYGDKVIVRQVGGAEIHKSLIVGCEDYMREATTKPDEDIEYDSAYEQGVRLGSIATIGANRSPGGITEASVARFLRDVAQIQSDPNPVNQRELFAAIVGGSAQYDALVRPTDDFIGNFPGLYERTTASPYVAGIWLGEFASAAAIHETTSAQ